MPQNARKSYRRRVAPPAGLQPHPVSQRAARRIWLHAQRLDAPAPFGAGPGAVRAAVEHLGYVQIDTIHVIERCHHHILQTRIPEYRRADLHQAQSTDKTVFEYWAHALAYLPARDMAFHLGRMKHVLERYAAWFAKVNASDVRKVVARIRKDGPLSIRDIDDDVLVEKEHLWASRKPSVRALDSAFLAGTLTVCRRTGMLKTFDLTDRHFGWEKRPKPAPERDVLNHLLDRALRAQGIVSLDSICYGDAKRKAAIHKLIDGRCKRGTLVPAHLAGAEDVAHWAEPEVLSYANGDGPTLVHILSPFDPLIIQRRRLEHFFGYTHRFEAYLPKDKRVFGYFALPVLVGDEIVAAIDLKTDRAEKKLLVQKWTWVGKGNARRHTKAIEPALHRFEQFQLGEAGLTP
ncbi:MAG TPA: crosslink repair DNA glycosylase YcaQ family protein [Rhizomicrobium sp.]